MGVIAFNEEKQKGWIVARWAFDRFLEDVIRSCPGDTALEYKLQQAMALDGLILYMLDSDFARRIVLAMREVAVATVDDRDFEYLKWKDGLNEDYQRSYREGVKELLAYIEEELKGEDNERRRSSFS